MRKRAALAIVAVLLLTGCTAPRVLSLTADESDQPACTDLSPIAVENLETDRTDCGLSGAALIFPDGIELETSPFGGTGSQESSNSPWVYGWIEVGDYGMVASMHRGSCDDVSVWGSDEAIDRARDAFGEMWPCDP